MEDARERNQGLDIPCQDVRKSRCFPKQRLFSVLQEQVMKDVLISPYSLDMITLFSLRPPELQFIKSPKLYLSYFNHGSQIKNCEKSCDFVKDNLSLDIFNCMWINGANQQVRVREGAIEHILQNVECKGGIRKLFINLKRLCDRKNPLFTERGRLYTDHDLDEDDLYNIGNISPIAGDEMDLYCNWREIDYPFILDCFVLRKSSISRKVGVPIPVLYPVKPSNYNKFLLHIALSMGEFISEGDLYCNAGSSVQLLRNANLLISDSPTENDVIHLTRRYILEQLIYLPKGTFLFDSYVVQSYQALQLMILENLSSPSLSPS